eukprot:14421453-Alexandrium_andersonii.AAC.1
MAGSPRRPRPQARGPLGAPRGPEHLDKSCPSLTSPVLRCIPLHPLALSSAVRCFHCFGRSLAIPLWASTVSG